MPNGYYEIFKYNQLKNSHQTHENEKFVLTYYEMENFTIGIWKSKAIAVSTKRMGNYWL